MVDAFHRGIVGQAGLDQSGVSPPSRLGEQTLGSDRAAPSARMLRDVRVYEPSFTTLA